MMAKNKLTKEEVKHIANLSKLTLSDKEIVDMSAILEETIGYIQILNELDTENIERTYQVTGKQNVFQEDTPAEVSLGQEKALNNASEVIDNKFAVKAVFDRQ